MNFINKMFIISGVSGAGKSTIIKWFINLFGMRLAVSCTTRPPRMGEVDGVDYHFISREEFMNRVSEGLFLEHEKYGDNFYGTLKSEANCTNKSVVFDVEPRGAITLKTLFPDAVSFFIDTPSRRQQTVRLKNRGTETKESLKNRLSQAQAEQRLVAENQPFFDYTIINKDLKVFIADMCCIAFQEMGGVVIAVDGVSGGGKNRICSDVASYCDIQAKHIDSGALYRMITLVLSRNNTELTTNSTEIKKILVSLDSQIKQFFESFDEYKDSLNTQEVDKTVAFWAGQPAIREYVFKLQMELMYKQKTKKILIVEGRDITTKKARYARDKFFIYCSLKERARRRLAQGNRGNFSEIVKNLKMRDSSDRKRRADPLFWNKKSGVIRINNTKMQIEEQMYHMLSFIKEYQFGPI